MRKPVIVLVSILLIVIAVGAFAQNRRGAGTPPAAGAQPTFGPAQSITGSVVSFSASAGSLMPLLVVDDGAQKSFVLGPYWFLAESKFAAAAGDRVTVVSLTCSECPNGNAVVSVTNLSNGTAVTLRDSSGLPLWKAAPGFGSGNRSGNGPGNGQGQGMGRGGRGMGNGDCNGVLPDVTRAASFEGTIVSLTGGPGVGHPELTVATASGNKTFVPAPYRVALDAGYTFTAGAKVTLTAAPVTHDDEEEWVIVTLHDVASGLDLLFRNADGSPQSGPCGQHRP